MKRKIKDITTEYITVDYGNNTEKKQPVSYASLKRLLKSLQQYYLLYDLMLEELEESYNNMNSELEELRCELSDLQKRIDEDMMVPAVRRGLSEMCMDLELGNKKYDELRHKMSGVWSVSCGIRRKKENTESLIGKAQTVLNEIK